MDLWDLTRMLFRRWYFAVPMLVLSMLTVAVVGTSVSPDYSSKGYINMIPPVGAATANPAAPTATPVNPWMSLGFTSLGQVTIIKVTSPEVLDGLAAAGLTDNVTVTMNTITPLMTVESIGTTPEQASATTHKVIQMLQDQIAAQQTQYGVTGNELIRTQIVDDGSKVTTQTSKVKRLLIVAAGLGLLLTIASTIGLDAFLKRKHDRRRMEDGAMPEAAVLPRTGPTILPSTAPAQRTYQPPALPAGASVMGQGGGPNGSADPDLSPTYLVPDRTATANHDGEARVEPDNAPNGAAPDTTIVLPLSYLRWSRDDKSRDH